MTLEVLVCERAATAVFEASRLLVMPMRARGGRGVGLTPHGSDSDRGFEARFGLQHASSLHADTNAPFRKRGSMQRQTALELLDGGQVVGPRRRALQLRRARAVLASNDVVDIGRRRWHAAARATRQVGSTAESGQRIACDTRHAPMPGSVKSKEHHQTFHRVCAYYVREIASSRLRDTRVPTPRTRRHRALDLCHPRPPPKVSPCGSCLPVFTCVAPPSRFF